MGSASNFKLPFGVLSLIGITAFALAPKYIKFFLEHYSFSIAFLKSTICTMRYIFHLYKYELYVRVRLITEESRAKYFSSLFSIKRPRGEILTYPLALGRVTNRLHFQTHPRPSRRRERAVVGFSPHLAPNYCALPSVSPFSPFHLFSRNLSHRRAKP